MAKQTKYPFNLLGDDAATFSKIKAKVEKRLGIALPTVHIIRLALLALAEEEGVK